MITADKLTLLINMPVAMLTTGIRQAGYKKDSFTSAKFIGMTNAGQFCYRATYRDPGELADEETNVFVNYDSVTDKITFDY